MTSRFGLALLDNVDPNTQGLNAVKQLIQNLVGLALVAAGALSIVFIIIGGIKFATSAGDPARLKSAKQTLTYAIGGLILALISGAIINTVFSVVGK